MPPAHGFCEHRLQTGFTYLGLMILVAVLALATSATLTLGSLVQRREAEQRLLEVGDTYRRAISSYLNSSPTGDRRYPGSLADLLKDPRYPGIRRHLRQLYPDPITGGNDWGLVPAPGGGIMGIHSLSDARPIKIAGFEAANQAFEKKSRYSQWLFVVMPIATGVRTGPGQGANAPLPIANPFVPPPISGLLPSPNP
ncbi:MAG: type II secretion system protein [Accumulibacter sp.]|jgi:type II secretory pathway pseudopilin PulG|uniref:type II secretion system protein n=1 Tax=Accumulibacter sp. TaxID=2053492 RepID=UPI002FC31642